MILIEPEWLENAISEDDEPIHLYDSENDPFGFVALCGEDLTNSAFEENYNPERVCPMCEAMEIFMFEPEA